MPATVNGIGTHYYGKSNASSRTGVCRACGATCRLDSYDTRLWLVVIYIPIIPLGRKRITDQCSRCRRHWVADKAVYEASKRENITAAMVQYEKQPTPESALDLHGSLLAFHQFDKAKDFRTLAMKQHRDSDALFQGLAAQMEQVGQAFETEPFYEQAYALRPDLPEICFGVADARIADGRLDEARRLLKPLETPVDAQNYSLGRVEMLARAYQRAGRHAETLEICKHLLTELPQIGEIREFRQLVSASEKALDQSDSMLPIQSVSVGGSVRRFVRRTNRLAGEGGNRRRRAADRGGRSVGLERVYPASSARLCDKRHRPARKDVDRRRAGVRRRRANTARFGRGTASRETFRLGQRRVRR